MNTFTIIGAGITGNTAAIALTQLGHKVVVYEKGPNPTTIAQGQGKSINLAESWRSKEFFEGLAAELPEPTPMNSRLVHQLNGAELKKRYNQWGEVLLSINRNDLAASLCRAAEKLGVVYHFNCGTEEVNPSERTITLKDKDGTIKTESYEYLLGCDGSNSKVAQSLDRDFKESKDPVKRSQWCYQEYEIPAKVLTEAIDKVSRAYQLNNPEEFHIWVGNLDKVFLIALPNADKTFTLTLFCHEESKIDLQKIKSQGDVDAIQEVFKNLMVESDLRLVDVSRDFSKNPVSHIYSRSSLHWHENSNDPHVLLLGDSAHAFPPFLGLGFNAGVEDVAIFVEKLKANPRDVSNVFREFASKRRPDMEALRDASIDNAAVLGVSHPDDELKFYITEYLERLTDCFFVDPHTMYSFDHRPHQEARFRQLKQDEMLNKLVESEGLREAFKAVMSGEEKPEYPIECFVDTHPDVASVFKKMVKDLMDVYRNEVAMWKEENYHKILLSPYFKA